MANEIVRKHTPNLERTLEVKSLKDLVRAKTAVNPVLLIDVSGSMGLGMRNGKRRIDGLRDTVKEIQSSHRDTRMIAFGMSDFDASSVGFVGTVPEPSGGTPLHTAIAFARKNEIGRAVVISDGIPDSRTHAMEEARSFGGRIDVVFVGNPGEPGEEFLRQLAEATGGTAFTGDLSEPKQLGKGVIALLEGGTIDEDDDED